ncbi:unnamed protein product, partial [Brassica oleracea]
MMRPPRQKNTLVYSTVNLLIMRVSLYIYVTLPTRGN